MSIQVFIYLIKNIELHVFEDGNDLSGTIPSEIMRLKQLSELILGKVANLNDVLPSSNTILIYALHLDLNELTGSIPDFHPDNKLKIVSLGKDFGGRIFGTLLQLLQAKYSYLWCRI